MRHFHHPLISTGFSQRRIGFQFEIASHPMRSTMSSIPQDREDQDDRGSLLIVQSSSNSKSAPFTIINVPSVGRGSDTNGFMQSKWSCDHDYNDRP